MHNQAAAREMAQRVAVYNQQSLSEQAEERARMAYDKKLETLDGLSVEQLEDLAKRAQATIDAKRKAEREQKAKDAKDIIPEPGVFWVYGGKAYTRYKGSGLAGTTDGLLRIPVGGGFVEWNCIKFNPVKRFSTMGVAGGWYKQTDHSPDTNTVPGYDALIGRLLQYAAAQPTGSTKR